MKITPAAAAVKYLSRQDPVMKEIIGKIGPCTLKPQARRSPYDALMQSVIFQQLHGKAAETILKRFKTLYGGALPKPAELLRTPEPQLRAAGLSGGKMRALQDIAAKAQEGLVPTRRQTGRMTDAELVEHLTQIRGVGPWTVDMLLIFTLGRPDVLPATDFGVRKGFGLAYRQGNMPTPAELLTHGERWRPFRTYAAWYLWRLLDEGSSA
jgi:3-methyladenine DNA glycosylase/8-oxoguanine DNA glycosylase